jgi:gamma-glutamylcysteine synthetase
MAKREPFSAGYALIRGVRIDTWPEDEAVMDYELYRALKQRYGNPIVGKIGGIHYQFRPATDVLADSVAIPEHSHGKDASQAALLIRK